MPKHENIGGGKPIRFYNTIGDKFATLANHDDPKAVKRTNKNGKIVFERHYAALEGHLVDVKKKNNEPYGYNLVITLQDEEERMVISFPLYGGLAISILRRLENIVISEPLNLSLWKSKDDKGKERVQITMRQDRTSVPLKWEKNQLPDWKKVTVKGVTTWDNSEQVDFLFQKVSDWAATSLKEEEQITPATLPATPAIAQPQDDLSEDDLPF